MMTRMRSFLNAWVSIGLSDLSQQERSKRYAFNVMVLISCTLALSISGLFVLTDFGGLRGMWAPVLTGLAFLILPLVAIFGAAYAVTVGTGMVILYFGYLTYLVGSDAGVHLMMIAGILGGLTVMGPNHLRLMIFLCLTNLIAMLVSYNLFQTPAYPEPIAPATSRMIHSGMIISLAMMVGTGVLTLAVQVARAEAALEAEHARSEALLHNLLPDEIAQRLKDRPGEVIADGLPAITLLFADIVDFTPRSARMRPEDLITWLNRIFSRFDELTAERGLEKIKTIGDAYMVAAGLPIARDDHAEIIADMALAMQAEVARLSGELGEPVDLRVGIHSGPAIAGVIGTSKVFYDVWGDTVNTASRMESHGEPGQIQVTAATKVLLEDTYQFTRRGPVEIKGIGMIETWWLDGRRA